LKGGHRIDDDSQEVLELRERGWEGLPPPPVFATWEPNPTSTCREDPGATALGLPSTDPEAQDIQPPPPESATASEAETTPSRATQSPSISIATLSDITIASASDDESISGPTVITPHNTLYLEDGNIEVLCGTTVFRIHTGVLYFHSPTLRQIFTQGILTTRESPNGCPRISSADTAGDFATLLKVIYLPGYVLFPPPRWIIFH
jgi:hypothetical protein